MSFEHVSVMLHETVDLLGVREGGVYVDGTLGGGGHSAEILRRLGGTGHLYGIDRDGDALAAATARLSGAGNFTAIRGNFHDVRALLAQQGVEQIDGMMVDLGVSSYQLDTAERGFSYHADAPLDMRMDQRQALTAATIVNTWDKAELTRILRDYAEEKWAARIADIIIEHRARKPIETTGELVACVDAAIPKKVRMQDSGHSARRTFQALRIAVNDELDPLRRALTDMVDLLVPGGHLAVLTFHSLEDRIVKQTFRTLANPCTCPPKIPVCICGKKPVVRVLGGGGIKPGAEEIERNPRSRSAMLRGCEKL
ncbi:MAG: 16S rRNA (cytosine(1402)-N(4))-methyltransferase RsmH [Candidatus Ventricola sp.]